MTQRPFISKCIAREALRRHRQLIGVMLFLVVLGAIMSSYKYVSSLSYETDKSGFAAILLIHTQLKPLKAWLVYKLPFSSGLPYEIPYAREQELVLVDQLPFIGGQGFVTQFFPPMPLNATMVLDVGLAILGNGGKPVIVSLTHDVGYPRSYFVMMAFTQMELDFITGGWIPQGGPPPLHIYAIYLDNPEFIPNPQDNFIASAMLEEVAGN